jgi:hypothetical protein
MNHLTEANFNLCQQYLNMVSVIDEGFSYVISSFTDYSKTEGELVLSDIIQALTSIAQTNTLLEQGLADDPSVQRVIASFQDVANEALKLDDFKNDFNMKMTIINELLYPSFSAWKDIVQNAIGKYIKQ